MQFKIGDLVVSPAYGTGQIVNIEKKQFSDKGERLYYKVALPKLFTLWAPVKAQEAGGLRLITAKSELDPTTP
jgi:CarD family transcriptional regulator